MAAQSPQDNGEVFRFLSPDERFAARTAADLQIAAALASITACPACDGSGALSVWWPDNTSHRVSCGTCSGTGQRDDIEAVAMIHSALDQAAALYGYCIIPDPSREEDELELALELAEPPFGAAADAS